MRLIREIRQLRITKMADLTKKINIKFTGLKKTKQGPLFMIEFKE